MNFNNIWYILCLFSVSDARINQTTAQANKMLHANLMNHEMIYCNYTPDSKVKLVLTKVGKYLDFTNYANVPITLHPENYLVITLTHR